MKITNLAHTKFTSKISQELITNLLPRFDKRANPSLGGTTRNYLKEWLRNQKQSNHFLGPFSLIFFTTINYYFSMFIHCMFEVYLGI